MGGTDGPITITSPTSDKTNSIITTPSATNNQDLLDLLGGLDLSTPASITDISSPTTANLNGNNILSMIPPSSATNITTTSMPALQLSGLGGVFGSNDNGSSLLGLNTINTTPLNGVKLTALDKNGLNVILVPQKNNGIAVTSGCLRVIMTATNNSLNTLEQYLFQAAVPKSFTLQMLSPSGSVLPPGGTITQEMRLTSSAKVSFFCYMNFYFRSTGLPIFNF